MKIYKQNPWDQTVSINQLLFFWINPISHVRAVKFSSWYFHSFCSSCLCSAGTHVQVGRWACAGSSACSACWPPAQRRSRELQQGHRPATSPACCGSCLGSAVPRPGSDPRAVAKQRRALPEPGHVWAWLPPCSWPPQRTEPQACCFLSD